MTDLHRCGSGHWRGSFSWAFFEPLYSEVALELKLLWEFPPNKLCKPHVSCKQQEWMSLSSMHCKYPTTHYTVYRYLTYALTCILFQWVFPCLTLVLSHAPPQSSCHLLGFRSSWQRWPVVHTRQPQGSHNSAFSCFTKCSWLEIN